MACFLGVSTAMATELLEREAWRPFSGKVQLLKTMLESLWLLCVL